MMHESSSYCGAVGLFLNCRTENGMVLEVFLSQEPKYELGDNDTLRRINAHLNGGEEKILDIPVKMVGTKFQKSVWRALRRIPPGSVRTYSQVAEAIGRPNAARAVGNAVAANHLLVLVPCHRVVSSNGPGGFSAEGGVETKKRMLAAERRAIPDGIEEQTFSE